MSFTTLESGGPVTGVCMWKKMERGPSLQIETLVMEKLDVKSDSMDERGFHFEGGCWNMLIRQREIS